jgi:hypothetical protein
MERSRAIASGVPSRYPFLRACCVRGMGVDAGNNDPVQLWRHAGAALDGRTADRVTALLRDVQLASFEAVVTLVNKLAEDGQRGWLFHGGSGRRDPA